MNFGLDYDGTITSDPELWKTWAFKAKARGHKVYVVTMRYPSELVAPTPIDTVWFAIADKVIATSRLAKRPFMRNEGIDIHVWIDDHPEAVVLDAKDIWPDPAPEGQPVIPDYE